MAHRLGTVLGGLALVALGAGGAWLLGANARFGSDHATDDLVISTVPAPDRDRPLLPPVGPDEQPMAAAATLSPPQAQWQGTHQIGLALRGYPSCQIAVGDSQDRAVHLYSTDGTYLHSISDGPRESSALNIPLWITFGPTGTLYVADLAWGTIAQYEESGARKSVWRIAPAFPNAVFGSEIAVDRQGRVFDDWFSSSYSVVPGPWSDTLPLIRVFDSAGRRLPGIGSLVPYPGVILTPAMNRSHIMVDGDTVWVANRVGGTLTGYSEDSRGRWRSRRVIELPVFYHMSPPSQRYFRSANHYSRRTDPHIVAIDRVAGGGFVLAQALGYASVEGVGLRAKTVLTAYSATGAFLGAVQTGGMIVEVRALPELIVVTQYEADYKTRKTLVFPNPFWAKRVRKGHECPLSPSPGPSSDERG